MIINPLRMATLLVVAALTPNITATAQDQIVVPDFTKGAKLPKDSRHDWNLGPTGLRGWIFCDKLVTTDARQILITKVDKGSPAADTFRVGDVILGVGGKLRQVVVGRVLGGDERVFDTADGADIVEVVRHVLA